MKYLHIVNGSMQLRKLSSLSTTGMALLRYLQVLPRRQLPDAMGALSFSLPSSAIAEANAAVTNARHQEKVTKAKRGPYMKLSNELKSKSLVRTEILRQQDTSPSCSRLLNCRVERIIINNAVELISPNRMCAKINLAKFSRNTTHLGLAKFFPGENFPLYGMIQGATTDSVDCSGFPQVWLKICCLTTK